MGYGIQVEVTGEYALFTRPEMKVERVSYDVITPSAARGLIEAVYWKPAIRWVIDRIYVCSPIQFTNIRRNELKSKIPTTGLKSAISGAGTVPSMYAQEEIVQRASTLLKDVRYILEAHFELTPRAGEEDTVEKHYNIILRRLKKGQCYHQPYLGCREFPAAFRLFEGDPTAQVIPESQDLGYMLYDMDYAGAEIAPGFFRAVMDQGIIDLTDCEVVQ